MNTDFKEKFCISELSLKTYKHWILSVRPKQVTPGSLVISLKRSCATLGALTKKETKELQIVFAGTERLLKKAFGNDKINYLSLMMVDDQVHFHVLPRYEVPLTFEGKEYKDNSWPGPIDITKTIEQDGFEVVIYNFLIGLQKSKRKVVGYTTGVYDLFHIGHLNVLKAAKQECDYLIVGVTTDELSISRKDKAPLIPLRERMEIVGDISFVDEVVAQVNMDKMGAWKANKFDKMFVGSDWKGTDKWNQIEKEFAEVGVEIVYFPYTESTSSTAIRKMIENKLV